MSLIFEDENHTRDDLAKLCKTHHEGIEREATQYELNIPTRREIMVEELGSERATKLEKYWGLPVITKKNALDIITTLWPEAPGIEVKKAIMLCVRYQLDPQLKHVYILGPFRKRSGEESWAIALGIGCNRLLAHRQGSYSYMDDTPRIMTDEEQKRIRGKVDPDHIWAITKLRDQQGNTAQGYGSWSTRNSVYGDDTGNTPENMAMIRSERQALDRLFPDALPPNVEVVDERFIGKQPPNISIIEGEESTASLQGDDEIGGAPGSDEPGRGGAAAPASLSSPKLQKSSRASAPGHIDLEWLNETMATIHWDVQTVKTWIAGQFKEVDTKGELLDVLGRLNRQQAEKFTKELQSRADRAQPTLFGEEMGKK